MSKHYVNRKKGAAIITAVIFFVVISVTMAVGLSSPVVREYVTARDFEKSKGAYYLSEAGMEDAVYRLRKAKPISAQEVIFLAGNTATTTITTDSSLKKTITSVGDIIRNTRHIKSTLTTTTGESFIYGVWAGAGGVKLQQSSTITGNLFSVGPVTGSNNVISGTVISGGSTGLNGSISGIQNASSSSMYAGTIANSTIAGNAYCNSISGSSTSTCNVLTEQIAGEFPITAADIANWESVAETGGSVTCSAGKYKIDSDVNFGPKKVPCDLEIVGTGSGGGITVTLQGPIWVTGNITLKNQVTVRVDPVLTGQVVVMIADKPTDRHDSSRIDIQGTGINFYGAPGGNSWVMLISENNAASLGDPEEAISFYQSATGVEVLLYARLGDILLQQSSSVAEVTAYMITLQNTANVTYSQGLQNALFTSGPGGAWYVQDWMEGQ
ncbi:MAG TPA: hypothetical protein DCS23_00350 [Candidatus Yonathbacteria bacterium]|nr:hypothetical protein [Candidatus Yonathbacteria bacterium]